MNRDQRYAQPLPGGTVLNKDAVYRCIEERARGQQQPGETLAQAIARFLDTPSGKSLYSQYRDAVPGGASVDLPQVHAAPSPRDTVYAQAHAAAMRQRTADESEAQAVARYFQTAAGAQAYAEYRAADATGATAAPAPAGSLAALSETLTRTRAALDAGLTRLEAAARRAP